MNTPPPRPTKHLATRDGLATPRLVRADIADDKVSRASAPAVLDAYENALDLFPEEHPSHPAPPPVVASAPQPEMRRFAWPQADDEWSAETRATHDDTPEAADWPERARSMVPVVIASVVFLGSIAGVAVWVMGDIREASFIQNFRPTPSAVPAPAIQPRPQSWASGVTLQRDRTPDPKPIPPSPATDAPAPLAAAPVPPSPRAANEQSGAASALRTQKPEAMAERKPGTPQVAPAVATQPPKPPISQRPAAGFPVLRPESAPVARASSLETSSPAPVATNIPPPPRPEPTPVVEEPIPVAPAAVAPAPRPPVNVAPTAAAIASAAPVVRRDEDDVRYVLGRYRSAYSDLDAFAARDVWPTVDIKSLSRAFDQLSSQNVEFRDCQVSVADAKAVANCDGSTWYVPKVGGKSSRNDNRRWRFDLHKGDEGWTIDSVSSK